MPAIVNGPAPAAAKPESSGSESNNSTNAPAQVAMDNAPVIAAKPSPASSSILQTPKAAASTSAATSTSTETAQGSGGNIITSLSQLAPANCLREGQVWAGPAGSDDPAHCDGA